MPTESPEPTLSADPLAVDDFAAQLLRELDEAPVWPLPREHHARQAAMLGRAFRKSDRGYLRNLCGWDQVHGDERNYHIDSLAKRIAVGWADFLFADDLTITAASNEETPGTEDEPADEAKGEGDAAREAAQTEIDMTVEAIRLPALLHRAERIAVSEGEVYWKLHVNHAVAEVALLTFCSRLDVVPLFYGEMLMAVAFVTERHRETIGTDDEETTIVYRHAEIHTNERVVNVLYRGEEEKLGARIELDAITQTAGYAPEWQHDLPMLAGRVVNDLDDDPEMGVGEFEQIQDQLLDLNEAMTIAAENARLTGQDRIFSAGRFMQADGSFDASLQVFQVEDDGGTLGEGEQKPPITAIEKKYDAQPLWLHITNLVKTALNRVGLVPQWVGEETTGSGAETGVAIRLKFIPTTNTAKGKLREWKHEIPHIVDLQLRIASLPVALGGFGRKVAQDEPPAVEFGDPIPADQSRDLLDVAAATDAQVMSRRTAIATLHPEWSPEQVEEEITAIKTETPETPPIPPPPGFRPPEPPSTGGR